MNRRQLLEEVAAGRLAPRAAARLLDPPAPVGSVRAARVRSAYQAVDVVGDPAVPDLLIAGGTQRVQRDEDVLVVSDAVSGAAGWQGSRRLALRANPKLELDIEIVGASLSVWGMGGPIRAVVQAGTGSLEGVRDSLDLRVVSGSARILGVPNGGDWSLRADSASLEVVLAAGTDATVSVASRHSQVDVLGSAGPVTLGRGTRSVEADAAFSNVLIRIG